MERNSNRIKGLLRRGPSRTKADYDDVVKQITKAWEEVVGGEGNRKLGAVFINDGYAAVRECGLVVPAAGEELEWIRENFDMFKKIADGGDELF